MATSVVGLEIDVFGSTKEGRVAQISGVTIGVVAGVGTGVGDGSEENQVLRTGEEG